MERNLEVCTMHRAGAINELVKGIDKHRIGICVLQEIRWLGKGTVTKRIMILYSDKQLTQDFILVDILWIMY